MQNVPNIVRDRLKVATPVSHPDADTLTAFSERSLAEAERAVVLEHLSRCGECREIVALALPETEALQPVLENAGSRWFAWPTLRWAFVAAGVAVVALGLVKYQRRQVASAPMVNKASSEQSKESANSFQGMADVPPPSSVQNHAKAAVPLLARNEATPAEPGPEKARTSVSHMNRFHGSALGAAVGGPLVSNQISGRQWQQNRVQNQIAASTPISGNATNQIADVSGGAVLPAPGAPFNTQLAKNQPVPAPFGSGAGYAVDKAKLPVPPASLANGSLDGVDGQPPQQSAQDKLTQPVAGQIGGYVVDPSGAVVSNARITITPSQARGGTASTTTNSQGAWLIAGLSSGSYRAEAEAPGFKTTILDLNYDANQPSMFSFTLSPGNVSETVEVSSAQIQVQAQGAPNEGAEMKPAVGASEVRVLNIEQAALSPARLPRWSINPAGGLERSLDQGNTWQDVNVSGAALAYEKRDLDVSGTQSAKDAKSVYAKAKIAGKKSASSPVFRAVVANGADVWAGGLNGLLYHSTDSGNHWTQVVASSAGSVLTGDIVSIEFPDLQHGKLSTSTAETWISADSGQTWQKQ